MSPSQSESVPFAKPTVLVVEDESLLIDVISDELEEAGYRVLAATTGEQAMTFLQSPEPIDLLFTDIRLPGTLDGWKLAEAARHLRPELPVIYASGYTVDQPREVPGSLFLTKPYRPSAVIRAISGLGVSGHDGA
jgi:CheY-like chemotaxis protein